jgi:uncharacterized membrane protein
VSEQKSIDRFTWLIAVFILFTITAILVHRIPTTYMISDEYLVYRFTRGTLAESIQYLAYRDVHPPLWFSFFWFWQRFAGQSDFAGRMQAILFSMITISLIYQLGRRWFGTVRYGFLAMGVLGTSALFTWYSLEIRPYALAMLFTCLSMFLFQRWMSQQTRQAAFAFALVTACLLYIHYFLLLFIFVQGLYIFLRHRTKDMLRQGMSVTILVGLFWLPWFPFFLNQFVRIRNVELASGSARGVAGSSVTTEATSVDAIVGFLQLASNGQIALYGLILTVGLFYCWRKANYRLALAWALGVPGVAFLFNLVVAVYSPRYIVNFVIGLALVLAASLGMLPARIRWALAFVFLAISFWALPSELPTDIVPYNVLYSELSKAIRPGDIIFLDKGGYGDDVMKWNYNRHLTLQTREDATRNINEALLARRIWQVTSEWFDKDVEANFRLIELTHPRQTGFGQCDKHWCYLIQLMEASPWSEPKFFGDSMAFWGADIDSVNIDSIQVRLWWILQTTPKFDYSISLRLVDANGDLVSQADGPINNYNVETINTAQMEPGRIYVDFRDLSLPKTIKPGTYKLELVVYDWQTNNRLLLSDTSDSLLVAEMELPTH